MSSKAWHAISLGFLRRAAAACIIGLTRPVFVLLGLAYKECMNFYLDKMGQSIFLSFAVSFIYKVRFRYVIYHY